MKEECAIVFHCNKDYVFALGAMLYNLDEHAISYSKIIVYTDFHDDSIFNSFYKINKNIEFIYYPLDDFINEFKIDITNSNIKSYIGRYTHLCYIKLKIFELLSKYKHVLFMDLDMYITENFDEIFNLDCDIAWRCGVTLLTKFSKSNLDIKTVPYLNDADKTTSAPNGGFILVNDTIAYDEIYSFSKEFFCKYIEYFNSTIDEIVFSIAVLCKKLRLTKLDLKTYNTPSQQFTSKTKIVHFIGRETKPWSNILFQSIFHGWLDNYKLFLDKMHCISEKVRNFEHAELSSCRLEFTYNDNQKYGMTYQICQDHSIQCYITFNAEKYVFDPETLHNLNAFHCHDEQSAETHSNALSPEKLLLLFEYLKSHLQKAFPEVSKKATK